MNKHCPNCRSPKIYCHHPHSLDICCDNCNYKWQAQQVRVQILQQKFWLSKHLKGCHYVEAWRSPSNPEQFAYGLAYSASIFGNPKGEFDTPYLALQAGIEEAKQLPYRVHLTELKQLKEAARQCCVAIRNRCYSGAANRQVYSAYMEELNRIERLAFSIKIRESQP